MKATLRHIILPAVLLSTSSACGDAPQPDTGLMGGIRGVTAHDLEQMQAGDYVLRAHDRRLTRVPARKSRLPHDPQGHVQRVAVMQSPTGEIYVKQHTLLCKSTDRGETWSSLASSTNSSKALRQDTARKIPPSAIRQPPSASDTRSRSGSAVAGAGGRGADRRGWGRVG